MASIKYIGLALRNIRLVASAKNVYQTCIPTLVSTTNKFSLVNHLQHSPFHTTSTNESKGKDKGKDKKKKGGKVEVRISELSSLIDYEKMQSQIQDAIDKFKDDLVKFVSLRSSVGSIESVKVQFENKDYELQELAQIVRKNPKTVILNMVSFPQAIPAALKALQSSGLNLNPQQEGTTVYLPIPSVTKEHREQLIKNTKVLYLKCRDTLSRIELEYIKKAKHLEGVSEDTISGAKKQINSIIDENKKNAKVLADAKYAELGIKPQQ